MNTKVLRLAGFFGLAAPLLGFAMVFFAINASPWFSWTNNALSDLGVDGFGSAQFNSGLVMTGSLMIMFFLGLNALTSGSRVGRAGAYLFLAGSIFLVGIGVFNETFGRIHFYFSAAFFISLTVSILTFGVFMLRNGSTSLALLSFVAGIVTPIAWSLPWKGAAIPEAISASAYGIWSASIGIWATKQGR